MNILSLLELAEHLNRVVALNYPETIWLKAEIAQANLNRGHLYISLIDKGESEGQVSAKATAIIWKNTSFKTFTGNLSSVVREGNAVLMKVAVRFNAVSGLQLIVQDIDLSYTIGEWQKKKEALSKQLKAEGIWNDNRKIYLPTVLQRLAILSSEMAAGLKDFIHQLDENPNQLSYQYTLFTSLVQGEAAPLELERAIHQIASKSEEFDALIIVRGGGAKADLMAFDEERVVRAVLQCGIPVITGIGHDIDQTLCDEVAHQSLKTPTAVAEYLHAHNLSFLRQVHESFLTIKDHTQHQLKVKELYLYQLKNQLLSITEKKFLKYKIHLQEIRHHISLSIQRRVLDKEKELLALQQNISLSDYRKHLEYGSVLVVKQDIQIKSATHLNIGDEVSIRWLDGEQKALIINNSIIHPIRD